MMMKGRLKMTNYNQNVDPKEQNVTTEGQYKLTKKILDRLIEEVY